MPDQYLETLTDIGVLLNEVLKTLQDKGDFPELLSKIDTTLTIIKDKADPESPDISQPIIDAVTKLGKELSFAVRAIDVKPNIAVAAPNVKVDAPIIDLSGIQTALQDLPRAFDESIANIPLPEKQDNSPLLESLDGLSIQLANIEKATRLKVQAPQTMAVTNLDGSPVGGGGLVQIQDSAGNNLTSSGGKLDVNASVTVGALTNDGTFALETGGNLAAIKTDVDKIPSQGQALAAASTPVVLPVAQITALTPPTSVGLNAGVNAIGSITNTSFTVTQATGTNLHTVVDNFPTTQPVSGSISVSNFPATQPVSGTFFQTTQPVSLAATVVTQETQPTTPTLTNVTMTGSSVTLFALNTSRRVATIYNDSGVTVYVKFGSTASATSFTVKLVDQAYYEVPNPVYTGIITALGASGTVRVTEVQ